jgi:hypothetical protein
LFSRYGCTQEFNGFLTAPKGGVLNLLGTKKSAYRLTKPQSTIFYTKEALIN